MKQGSIEQVRKFWDSRPCNIRHSVKPIGTLEYFEEVRQRKYFIEPHIKDFADFKKWGDKEVLEIGCGVGTDTTEFAINGATITAIDISSKSVALTKQRLAIYGLAGNILVANTEKLSDVIPPKPYALIYSFGVIHHTPHPDNVLKELIKYCSPNTELRIMLYSKWSWKVMWIILTYGHGKFWQWKNLVADYSEANYGSPVTYVYSKKGVKDIFERNGFDVIDIKKEHIFPYEIGEYVKYNYVKMWYFRIMPKIVFRFLEKVLGWHLLITARPSRD